MFVKVKLSNDDCHWYTVFVFTLQLIRFVAVIVDAMLEQTATLAGLVIAFPDPSKGVRLKSKTLPTPFS